MTITPNLPTSMRRLYLAVGFMSGLAALAIPSLETFERGFLGLVCLVLLTSGVTGFCCLFALLGLGAKRK